MGHKLSALLSDLVSDDSLQHKDVTPDLGMVLMLSTVFQGHGGPSREASIQAYEDENSLRSVMWWQRSGTRPEGAEVVKATNVSRDICTFQMMVVDIIVGNAGETLRAIKATNCKLPDRLERLQKEAALSASCRRFASA